MLRKFEHRLRIMSRPIIQPETFLLGKMANLHHQIQRSNNAYIILKSSYWCLQPIANSQSELSCCFKNCSVCLNSFCAVLQQYNPVSVKNGANSFAQTNSSSENLPFCAFMLLRPLISFKFCCFYITQNTHNPFYENKKKVISMWENGMYKKPS